MGDLKVGEGFIDAVMIRVTATGAAAVGLVPTCTLTRLSTGARVGLTVAEVSDGIYKVTDMAPGADDEWLTEWAVAGANTIYAPYKLFKVGGGDVQDIYDLVKAAGAGDAAAILVDTGTTIPALIAALNDLAQADILSDATPFDGADIAAILADTVTINWADITTIDGLIDDIIADIGVFPTANYATLAAYVEDIRARLIVILADVTGIAGAAMRGTDGAALVASGWDAALATRLQVSQNSELFGSTMQEELQLGAGAADVNLPDIILPNISGTIDRAYLHFKVRMVENTYAGVNKLAGAQSIRIKTDGGAWGVDDIAAITFPDDYVTLAASTREAGDVFGGMIDVSSEVDAFNDTYEMRWEDGQVDQDFINFNDIEMFLRVIFH